MTYGIIGVGAIGAAIVTGLCEGAQDAPSVVLSPRNASRAADLASRFRAVTLAKTNQDVIDGASVVLLCIRPAEAKSALGCDLPMAHCARRDGHSGKTSGRSTQSVPAWIACSIG
jgi:pyrroline-5-carboxylate reductase